MSYNEPEGAWSEALRKPCEVCGSPTYYRINQENPKAVCRKCLLAGKGR